jgi:hypothetical protein
MASIKRKFSAKLVQSKSNKKQKIDITHNFNSINSQYGRRENTDNLIILAQKQGINNFLAKLFNPNVYSLIVDGDKHNTRNTLLNNNFDNNKIITINKKSKINNSLHYEITLFEFLHKKLPSLGIKFGNIFADVINNHTESIRQIKQIFQMQMTTNKGIFALTCCLRGVNHVRFSHWYRLIIEMGENNGYKFIPINVPEDLIINLKSNKSKYKLKKNMSDNGANGKTGRTITAFFYFIKI